MARNRRRSARSSLWWTSGLGQAALSLDLSSQSINGGRTPTGEMARRRSSGLFPLASQVAMHEKAEMFAASTDVPATSRPTSLSGLGMDA